MLLVEELRALTDKLDALASPKEKVFFQFLIGKPLVYPTDPSLSEKEQVVFGAFCSESPKLRDLTEKLRGTGPIKGMHYSNNLIELAAFGRFAFEEEIENLRKYSGEHSTKEFFILKSLFPDALSYPPAPITAIDRIASKLLESTLSAADKPTIVDALYTSEDLLDVYILKRAYFNLLDQQPATRYRRDVSFLREQTLGTIRTVDAIVRIAVAFVAAYLLYLVFRWLVPLMIQRWSEAEPILAALQFLPAALGLVLVILIGYAPNKLKLINAPVTFLGTLLLMLLGINRKETIERISEYDESELE